MKKATTTLWLSLLSLMFAVFAFAVQDSNPPSKPRPKPKAVDCSTVDDAKITQDVQTRLSKAASLKDFRINVTTRESMVTLTGTVKTARNKGTATRVAKASPCVKKVDNQLTVEMASSQPRSN